MSGIYSCKSTLAFISKLSSFEIIATLCKALVQGDAIIKSLLFHLSIIDFSMSNNMNFVKTYCLSAMLELFYVLTILKGVLYHEANQDLQRYYNLRISLIKISLASNRSITSTAC